MSKSLYAYFKRKEQGKESQVTSVLLPDPKGPLSEDVLSSAISKVNKEILRFCAKTDTTKNKKKGPYLKVTPEMKATIAKYAIENGNCAASRKFGCSLERKLNENTVRSWMSVYKKELE